MELLFLLWMFSFSLLIPASPKGVSFYFSLLPSFHPSFFYSSMYSLYKRKKKGNKFIYLKATIFSFAVFEIMVFRLFFVCTFKIFFSSRRVLSMDLSFISPIISFIFFTPINFFLCLGLREVQRRSCWDLCNIIIHIDKKWREEKKTVFY